MNILLLPGKDFCDVPEVCQDQIRFFFQVWTVLNLFCLVARRLRVNAYKNGPKSPINGTSRKIDFACILSTDRS